MLSATSPAHPCPLPPGSTPPSHASNHPLSPVALHGAAKKFVAERLGLCDATLHAHGGLVIYVAAVLLIDGGMRSPSPWLIVLTVELGNELFDRLRSGSWKWSNTISDVANTMLWPTVLTGVAYAGLI